MTQIIIVGGGIAGLAAAYYACLKSENPRQIVLLEQASYWGGKIVTERNSDTVPGGEFVIEGGPDTFVVTKPWAVRLCKELGIAGRLKGTNPQAKKTYILKKDRLHELPGGLTMMIPTEIWPMVCTGLLSWSGKARMGLDFFLPAANVNGDESLGTFVTRRLGRAAYENLIEPLMSGIYAGDGDRLSLQSTFPYLRDLEQEHGGLVKGALTLRRARLQKERESRSGAQPLPGSRSLFLTPEGGLAEIVETLVDVLGAAGVDLRLNTAVTGIHKSADGYEIRIRGGQQLRARQLILATPAYVTASLIDGIAPELATELQSIEYISTATVTLAYKETDLPRPLDGYGYVIPRREKRKALACTWTSTKFPHRAPPGYALLRVFIGRAGQEDEIDWDEARLVEDARVELHQTLGITAEPLLQRVYTWEKSMPQYNLGHPERLTRIEHLLSSHSGLALAGNAYQGIGIPDCIHSGELAVERVFDRIPEKNMAKTG
jgi:protoporphyrinogen/coproporphyrinogen III oxidase